jgi:hypothetical protein
MKLDRAPAERMSDRVGPRFKVLAAIPEAAATHIMPELRVEVAAGTVCPASWSLGRFRLVPYTFWDRNVVRRTRVRTRTAPRRAVVDG